MGMQKRTDQSEDSMIWAGNFGSPGLDPHSETHEQAIMVATKDLVALAQTLFVMCLLDLRNSQIGSCCHHSDFFSDVTFPDSCVRFLCR